MENSKAKLILLQKKIKICVHIQHMFIIFVVVSKAGKEGEIDLSALSPADPHPPSLG